MKIHPRYKIPIKTANATLIKIRFSDEQEPSTSLVSISSTQYKIHKDVVTFTVFVRVMIFVTMIPLMCTSTS